MKDLQQETLLSLLSPERRRKMGPQLGLGGQDGIGGIANL
jgi:hypothetical protein